MAVAVLNGSATTDANAADVLSYNWSLVTDPASYTGVTVELLTDPASPYAYLRFHAEPSAPDNDWEFLATLVVSDGLHTTAADDDHATTTVRFFRPQYYDTATMCALGQSGGAGSWTVLMGLFLGLGMLRRRRQA